LGFESGGLLGEGWLGEGPSRGMMVLFVLQVHLQKDVGAGEVISGCQWDADGS